MRFLPFILSLVASSSLCAMVVSRPNVQKQLDQASLVAEVHVTAVESLSDPKMHALFSAKAIVHHIIGIHDDGGWFPREGDQIEIQGLGGEINGVGILVSGYPRPRTGKSYRASLIRRSDRVFGITGFEFGLVPLTLTRNFSRNRTDGSNGTGNGPFLYWDSAYFPLPYFISATAFAGFPEAIPAIDASFKTWRDANHTRVEFLAMGCSVNAKNENDGINNVILVTDSWPFDPAAIAITRNFYVSGDSPRAGLILDSDILLNGVDHQFTVKGEDGKYDIQDIVTHEAGHFLGLGHEVEPVDPDATMFALAEPDETNKRVLKADDILGLQSAYQGVGNKLGAVAQSSPCNIRGPGGSCGAVHGRPLDGWEPMGFLIFILANLILGRVLLGRGGHLIARGTSDYFIRLLSCLALAARGFLGKRSINS